MNREINFGQELTNQYITGSQSGFRDAKLKITRMILDESKNYDDPILKSILTRLAKSCLDLEDANN